MTVDRSNSRNGDSRTQEKNKALEVRGPKEKIKKRRTRGGVKKKNARIRLKINDV